jgi:hypothetical protein
MKAVTATILVLTATIASGCGKLDQQKFERVHRASRDVRENLSSGVTLIKFRELVGAYGTEVSLATDQAKATVEQDFVKRHQYALTVYRDSLTLWNKTLANQSKTIQIDSEPELTKIADRYGVGSGNVTAHFLDVEEARQKLWSRASAVLTFADEEYRGAAAGSLPEVPRQEP